MTEKTFLQKVTEALQEIYPPEEYDIHGDVFVKNMAL